MSDEKVVKLRLSLMGRPVRNYTFDKPVITIGRDPGSDVFVDNPGVSRDHFRMERTPAGDYTLVDLGSANGTFVNELMVHNATLNNNDVVRFGKYTLWIGYDADRRAIAENTRRSGADNEQHTVVLSRSELGNLLEVAKEKEASTPPPSAAYPAPAAPPVVTHVKAGPAPFAGIIVAFLLGVGLGAGAVWMILSR